MHLTVKDIKFVRACEALEEMPLGKRIDTSFQRSVTSWVTWRKKRRARMQARGTLAA